jgi:hypothetical protein
MSPTPGPAPGGEEAPRHFSFACYPVERVVVLVGMMLGPTVAVLTLVELARASRGPDWWSVLTGSPGQRLTAALMLLVALVLLAFGPLYLQYRALTRLTLTPSGFVFERRAFLPFGWLARHRQGSWRDLTQVRFEMRRRLVFTRPELGFIGPARALWVVVSDAWEEGTGPRPWAPREPRTAQGWRDHALVQAAQAHWQAALRARAESASKHDQLSG